MSARTTRLVIAATALAGLGASFGTAAIVTGVTRDAPRDDRHEPCGAAFAEWTERHDTALAPVLDGDTTDADIHAARVRLAAVPPLDCPGSES